MSFLDLLIFGSISLLEMVVSRGHSYFLLGLSKTREDPQEPGDGGQAPGCIEQEEGGVHLGGLAERREAPSIYL